VKYIPAFVVQTERELSVVLVISIVEAQNNMGYLSIMILLGQALLAISA
jgi:hypothetical protein